MLRPVRTVGRPWGCSLMVVALLVLLRGCSLTWPSSAVRQWPGTRALLAFTPTNLLLVSNGTKSIAYDPITGAAQFTLTSDSQIRSVAVSPDGQWFVIGTDQGGVNLWSLTDQRLVTRVQVAPGELRSSRIGSLAFSLDSQKIAWIASYKSLSGDDHLIYQVWDRVHQRVLRSLDHQINRTTIFWVSKVYFSPEGRDLVFASSQFDTQIFPPETQVYHLEATRREGIGRVVVSPDYQWLAVVRPGRVSIRRFADGQVVHELTYTRRGGGTPGPALSVAFSPDGRYLAVGPWYGPSGDLFIGVPQFPIMETVRLIEIGSWREVQRFQGHPDGAQLIVYSPDGQFLATSGGDESVRLWRVAPRNPWEPLVWISSGLAGLLAAIGRWIWARRTG